MRVLVVIAALLPTSAGKLDIPPAWIAPTDPFPIVGPIYYVGSEGLAAYLITTPDGAILIDGTMAENVPAIERNIRAVGVPINRIKWLLNSHAHFDHAAGLARLKRDSGAKLAVMDADARAIATGRPPSVVNYGLVTFPAALVDRVLHDGDTVTLGGITLTAVKTPGHTAGCTTWTMPVSDGKRTLNVMFPCSLTVAGNDLVDNPGYRGIVDDFRRSFARLASMQADVLLPAHPDQIGLLSRRDEAKRGNADAFVKPADLQNVVAGARRAFDAELERQRGALPH